MTNAGILPALMILISSSVLLILLTKWIHMNLYILKHILEKKGLLRYLEVILQNVKVYHDYCVYGHLDYAVRYCPDKNYQFIYQDYADLIEEILKTIIEDGKGIEVNTGGYKYGLGYPNPHPDILKRYLELGGEILTIGSIPFSRTSHRNLLSFNIKKEGKCTCNYTFLLFSVTEEFKILSSILLSNADCPVSPHLASRSFYPCLHSRFLSN